MDTESQLAVIFRVDGSPTIGTGHVMRCLALAEFLALRRIASVFMYRTLPPGLRALLQQSGHETRPLNYDSPLSGRDCSYGGQQGATEIHDADRTAVEIGKLSEFRPLAVIVDHYGLQEVWETVIAHRTSLPVLAIDDLGRPHGADALLDMTFGKSELDYQGRVPEACRLMIGSHFALLRPDFLRERKQTLLRRAEHFATHQTGNSILISMGGGDPEDMTGFLVEGLLPLVQEYSLRIHALVGTAYPYYQRLNHRRNSHAKHLEIHRNIIGMADFLAGMDLCIGASGSSSWERCCLGLPTISLVIAENQQTVATKLTAAGAVVDGGIIGRNAAGLPISIAGLDAISWAQRIVAPMIDDHKQRSAISAKAATITDGFGAMRVIVGLFAWLSADLPVRLEPLQATDAEITYQWQCFPGVRRYCHFPNIPDWEDHKAWLAGRLIAGAEHHTHLIIFGGIPAGIIRLDPVAASHRNRYGEHAKEISILVTPELQGKGIAADAIELALQSSLNSNIIAHVLQENAFSRRLFQKLGFHEVTAGTFVRAGSEDSGPKPA